MYRGKSVAVCIPAHNEERHIARVVQNIPKFVDFIVVVDDHSTDNTYDILTHIKDSRLIVIHHTENRGVGGATVAAHEIACMNDAEIIVRMDGDDQMDPSYIDSLIDPIVFEIAGYTKGNRLVDKANLKRMPKIRIFGNYILTYLNKILTGYWSIMDSQNGFTAIRRDILEKLDYKTLANGYMFENDMLFRLNQMNVPVLDVPMPPHYGDEVSGIRISKVIPEYLRFFTSAALKRLWRKYFLKLNIGFVISVAIFYLFIITAIILLSNGYWGRSLIMGTVALLAFGVGTGIDMMQEPRVRKS